MNPQLKESIEFLIMMLAGLGAFLYGVKELSDNMEKLANRRLKSLFQKTSKNPLVGVGIGAISTAIVQSSGLTTVMIVGFVNAGMMTLYQATAFIMGANIGTTITAQIAALNSLNVTYYAIALALLGMLINMFTKRPKLKSLGLAVAGLGMIFLGLELMSSSMGHIRSINEDAVTKIFSSVSNPFLLLLIGIVFTAIMQSSSAVTTIIIIMAAEKIVIGGGGNAVLYLILGSNIGSCVTSLLSSLGAGTDAKRASVIHLLFNLIGSAIFFILLICWPNFMKVTFEKWFSDPGRQIAMFHTFFNLFCTIIFLPCIKVFVFLATKLVPNTKAKKEQSFIDKRFLSAPTVAIEQANKETLRIADMAMSALNDGFNSFITKNTDLHEQINLKCNEVNDLSKAVTNYLVEISAHDLTLNDEKRISILHSNTSDIVRLAEIADNFIKYTNRAIKDDINLSPGVPEELSEMFATLRKLYDLTVTARTQKELSVLPSVDEEEEKLDAYRKRLIAEHIERLNRGECSPASSSVYINLVSNLERAGDHLGFIAHTIEEVAKP
ncbi:MAG: Na/Pi cotransporter family protein [Clostridia bacterium]|nr:Na/Pi cotransporter family protein [Clostridia bacterium]